MKTTIDIPDETFRRAKAAAAMEGRSLREYVTEALRAKLSGNRPSKEAHGWRSLFGRVEEEKLQAIDDIIREEFSHIDPESWR